jgi:hypothetical protein
MPFGNLTERPDLRSLFGALSVDQSSQLLDRLLAIERSLVQLADSATAHVGVPYSALGLSLVVRSDGSAVGIHGGPSGDVGDIWFDVSPSTDSAAGREVAPPWVVESQLVLFCSDSPEPGDDPNTHDLLRLEALAHTPTAALDAPESHVKVMAAELDKHAPARFTEHPMRSCPDLNATGTRVQGTRCPPDLGRVHGDDDGEA